MSESGSENLILASASPRRRELLSGVGVQFEVLPAEIDEDAGNDELPVELVERLARDKAEAVGKENEEVYVLGADTIVVLPQNGKRDVILGKPCDHDDARAMLKRLSGRDHIVITAFSLFNSKRRFECTQSVSTEVSFINLSDEDIDSYIATGEPMDKAGAYAIQGYGQAFISKIKGSYTNVVGLPVVEVLQLLRAEGLWSSANLRG